MLSTSTLFATATLALGLLPALLDPPSGPSDDSLSAAEVVPSAGLTAEEIAVCWRGRRCLIVCGPTLTAWAQTSTRRVAVAVTTCPRPAVRVTTTPT